MGLKDFAKNVGGAMNKGAMQAPVLHAAQFARSRFKFSNTGDLSLRPAPLLRPQVSINTEITVHKTNIASEKKKFGADVYPLLEASGGVWTEECTKLWTESLAKVKDIEAKIEEKRKKLKEICGTGEGASAAEDSAAVAEAEEVPLGTSVS